MRCESPISENYLWFSLYYLEESLALRYPTRSKAATRTTMVPQMTRIQNATRRFEAQQKNLKLRPDGFAEGVSEGIGPAANVVFVLGFDHHACQRLRARVPQHHAAGCSERLFRCGQLPRNLRQGIEGRLGPHFHVDDALRKDFQVGDQIVQWSRQRDDRCHLQGG